MEGEEEPEAEEAVAAQGSSRHTGFARAAGYGTQSLSLWRPGTSLLRTAAGAGFPTCARSGSCELLPCSAAGPGLAEPDPALPALPG